MLSQITAFLALGAIAHAAPAPVPAGATAAGAGAHSVPAIHNPNHVRNGTAALLKAYAKYHIQPTQPMSDAFMSALRKRQDSSVTATPADAAEYLIPVTVGGQTLNLDLDTGSADLWVFSSSLSSSSRSGHNFFTPSKSSTFKSLSGYSWDITYADGSGASGTVGTDTVTIGKTTVTGQAVEVANQVSSSFVSDASDGLVGLAFNNINTVTPNSQSTFFDNAASSLNSPIFAAYLPFNANGAYDFGYTDSTKYTGTLTSTSVSSANGFWEFPSTSYKVGSTVHTANGYTGIADTGTTLILMSDAANSAYYAQVKGASYSNSAGGYVFPCSATLPTLSFKIGSTYATIPSSLLNYGVESGSTCYGALQSAGGGSQNIYGDVFFNAYYVVFNKNGPTLEFAPSVSA
ncbi:39f229bb-fcb0-47b6-b0d1-2994cee8a9ff [Sclerotinia trifoliorum]|uniref:39f229bb-fcb0-47b6-b0d1-2994cee8a9ff n=1 Tax=Sclerotinia trifoliorum TaxID=28548 RepID=A0A8H2VSR5_9HELO|nr:39f229bb-fcb0-47b6-b0d1-2994cee8a9ff [Sclerotinia trifoliorum]